MAGLDIAKVDELVGMVMALHSEEEGDAVA